MKTGIHPQYHSKVTATCACGATYDIGSTMAEMTTEICSACHPFYTGKQKIMDTAGRVDKFKQREAAAKAKLEKAAAPAEDEGDLSLPESTKAEKKPAAKKVAKKK